MILTNGRIRTLDAGDRLVDTLVIRDGRVAFAGRAGEVRGAAGEPVVDLDGRAVVPGLTDAHAHLAHLARLRLQVDLRGARSEAEAAGRVAAAAAGVAPGGWVAGRNWDQERWPGGGFPGRASLDRVVPGHPVALVRVDGHATWANGAALRAAGITRHTPDPAGGRIGRDDRGEPDGLLVDTAQDLVRRAMPPESPERFEAAVREAIATCLAVGLTGLHEMGVDLGMVAAYRRLVEQDRFPFRNHAAVWRASGAAWSHYRERGPETVGDGRLRIGAVKLMADGALGSRGAALHAPYCDDPDNRGLLLLDRETVEAQAREALQAGFQVCVHAIGDRANTLVLDAFEAVLRSEPRPALPLRVEHAQILTSADIGRFRALGVVPSMQPTHCTSDMPWAPARLGPERMGGAYAWRALLDTGVTIAGGSDFPVEDPNPFLGLYAAVARRPPPDPGRPGPAGPDPGWQPAQRMTRAEALRAFTTWPAAAIGQAETLGRLTPGAWADLLLLPDDPLTCEVDALAGLRPDAVLLAGEVVHGAL